MSTNAELVHEALIGNPLLLKLLTLVIDEAMIQAAVPHLTNDEAKELFELLMQDIGTSRKVFH